MTNTNKILQMIRPKCTCIVVCRMVVDGGSGRTCEWDGRWNHIKKFLERSGPFTHPDFEPSTEVTISRIGNMQFLSSCVWNIMSLSLLATVIAVHARNLQNPCHWCWWSGMWATERPGMITIIIFLEIFVSYDFCLNKWPTLFLFFFSGWGSGFVRFSKHSRRWHGHHWSLKPQSAVSLQVRNITWKWNVNLLPFCVMFESIRYVFFNVRVCDVDQADRCRSTQGERGSWFHQQPHTWMLCSPVSFWLNNYNKYLDAW